MRHASDFCLNCVGRLGWLCCRQVDALWTHSRKSGFAIWHILFRPSCHKHCAIVGSGTVLGCNTLPKVVAADKSGNECRRWVLVHSLRVTELLNMSVEHDGDAVRHRHCFFLVVSYEHECDSQSALQQLQFDLHLFAQLAIECPKWFIEKQNTWTIDECARNCNTLLLAARHLAWLTLCQLGHLHHVERFHHTSCGLYLVDSFLA